MKCVVIDDDKLIIKVVEEFIKKTDSLQLEASFLNPIHAVNFIKQRDDIDCIFLDIEMPEMTGLEILETFKDLPNIIVISSKGGYAFDVFKYQVTDYLLKPITYSNFLKAIEKTQEKIQTEKKVDNNDVFIKTNSTLIKLKYDDIYWIEALENYVIVNTFEKKYTIHFTMKSIEQKVPVDKLTRIHRSYIVNTSKIDFVEDNTVVLKIQRGSKIIPIGKSYKNNFINTINIIN